MQLDLSVSLFSICSVQFRPYSHVGLFAMPSTAACQASLSITNFRSLPKFMSIESVMPSNHLILCRPLLLLPSIFPSIRVFSNESLGTTNLGSSSFSILSFCLFIPFMGFSRQEYWSGLPFPSPVDCILSDLSTMTRPSWVAPHSMAWFHWVRRGCGPCNQIG